MKQETSDQHQTIENMQIFFKNGIMREAKTTITNLWRNEWHLL